MVSQLAGAWHALKGATMMVDRFHLSNHVSEFCQTNLNPYNIPAMKGVNTEVCEQTFRWLAR